LKGGKPVRKSISILVSALVALMFALAGCSSSMKEPISVTGVALNKHALTLQVGNSETLVPAIEPSNATQPFYMENP
jgi:uncharacterized protein YjdB